MSTDIADDAKKEIGKRKGTAHADQDASHGDFDQSADFEQAIADGSGLGFCHACALESYAPEFGNQHVGYGGEPESELVGAHLSRAGAVGKQPELLFLYSVLHVTAGAVNLFVKITAAAM